MSKTSNNKLSFFLNKIQGKEDIEVEKKHKEVTGDIDSADKKTKKFDTTEDGMVIISDLIHFNPINRNYIVYLKSAGRNVNISEKTLKSILLGYSDIFGDPITVEKVMQILTWPRSCAEELLKVFGANHKMLPVTPMELQEKNDDEIIEDIDMYRKFVLKQKLEHKTWHEIQAQSLKWMEFQKDIVSPMEECIRAWKPSKITLPAAKKYQTNNDVLLINANDWHIGAETLKTKTFSGREYTVEIALKTVDNYIQQIQERLDARKIKPSKAFVLWNGDILHTCMDNFTRRGTQLSSEIVNEDLFKVGLDAMINFLVKISSLFESIEVSVGRGNHESVLSTYLGLAAQKILVDTPKIKIKVEKNWVFDNWINNVYVLASHGAHDTMKGVVVPRSGPKLQTFVQNHLLEKAGEISKAKQKIIILGHLHSNYWEDFGSFTAFRCGATVKADYHGEGLGHFTQAYQNCLLIGDNNVKEVWSIYL